MTIDHPPGVTGHTDGWLATILEGADRAGTAIIRCSRDLRYLSANRSYAELLGKPLDRIVGHSLPEVMGDAAFEVVRPYIDRVLARERVEYEAEIPFAGVGVRRVHAVCIPGLDIRGAVCGWVAVIRHFPHRRPPARDVDLPPAGMAACGSSQSPPDGPGIGPPLPAI